LDADRLARILGPTGMTVIEQLSSFLLVCIGVQIAWNGIKALVESLTLPRMSRAQNRFKERYTPA
jgi:small neutral amino acid transporter SnatA (MarC family)